MLRLASTYLPIQDKPAIGWATLWFLAHQCCSLAFLRTNRMANRKCLPLRRQKIHIINKIRSESWE